MPFVQRACSSIMDGSWPVRPIELPGRGIGLVAARDIAPGELIISEEPLILYPNELLRTSVCGCCLRMLSSGQDVSGTTVPTTGGCGACGMRRACSCITMSLLNSLNRTPQQQS